MEIKYLLLILTMYPFKKRTVKMNQQFKIKYNVFNELFDLP